MTNAGTWDSEGDARRALQTAVDDGGVSALSDPHRLDNLLRDLLPDSPREASLIVAAAEVDVAGKLTQQIGSHVDPETAVRLAAAALARGRALDPSACRWVAEEFAIALGYHVVPGDPDTAGWPALPPPPRRHPGSPAPTVGGDLPVPAVASPPRTPPLALPSRPGAPARSGAIEANPRLAPASAAGTPTRFAYNQADPRPVPSTAPGAPSRAAPVGRSPRRTRRLRAAIVVVVVLIVAVGGGATAIMLTRPSHTSALSPSTPTTVDAGAQGSQAARAIAADLAASATARGQVARSASGLEDCELPATSALSMTDAAISSRAAIVARLSTLNVNGLANGLTVQSELLQALNDSLNADRSFGRWMTDVVDGRSPCGGYATDPQWLAANAASTKATDTKIAFLGYWNPLATSYGLPIYQQSQL